jgi:hypothetical protein
MSIVRREVQAGPEFAAVVEHQLERKQLYAQHTFFSRCAPRFRAPRSVSSNRHWS